MGGHDGTNGTASATSNGATLDRVAALLRRPSRPVPLGGDASDGELIDPLLQVLELPAGEREDMLAWLQGRLWVRCQRLSRRLRTTLDTLASGPPREYSPLRMVLARELKHLAADMDFLEQLWAEARARRGDA